MSIFPGSRVSAEEVNIKNELLQQINHRQIDPLENIKQWTRVDNEVYHTEALLSEGDYYVLYKHPVHDYLDKLFLTNKADLIAFLQSRINPEREEGLDLIVASKDYSNIMVCNHDGQIYLV